MNITQIKRVLKANTKKIQSFVLAEEGVYFVTFFPASRPDGLKSMTKISLALKKAGAKVSKIIEQKSKSDPSKYRITFMVDNNFEISYCFVQGDEITSLMVLNIVELI